MRILLFGLFLCLTAVVVYAYQIFGIEESKPRVINQVQFDRCMAGRGMSDMGAIKACQNRQVSKTK